LIDPNQPLPNAQKQPFRAIGTFSSIFLAGFECSTHRRWDNERLDMLDLTGHARLCESDYALAAQHGMRAARDGFRWHLIEKDQGQYDWSSIRPMLQAARRQGTRVIWDLCHYGYPDWLDPWSAAFPDNFARFCAAAVRLIRDESGEPPLICAVNEISFWAWLGAKEGKINPHGIERAHAFKRQLVKVALAGVRAAKRADAESVVICAEPLINIVRDTNNEVDIRAAMDYHRAQYEAVDLMLGRMEPELGGFQDALDIIGVNFYPHNQWRIRGGFVPLGHHDYEPLSSLLREAHERYGKPLLIAETGAEHSARPAWISYVCQEVRDALKQGVPVAGICLYPVTEYRGWDNERICQVGLFGMPDDSGNRSVYQPLVRELERQHRLFSEMDLATLAPLSGRHCSPEPTESEGG
jgi:beta-glucosidase/6-phospho-beta-glucosidase/beta-galactosidase